MAARTNFPTEEARRVDKQIGIDWASAPFDVEQLRSGTEVELERGGRSSSSATRWRSGRRAAANALTCRAEAPKAAAVILGSV